MRITRFEPQHFSYLHRSLCHYMNMNIYDAKALSYVLYCANQDTYYELSRLRRLQQVYLGEFLNIIDNVPERIYLTVVQLYRALEALLDSVKPCYLIEQERIYLKKIDEMMLRLENQFYQKYDVDICGPKSVYVLCSHHLVPYEQEPIKDLLADEINERQCRDDLLCDRCRVMSADCMDEPQFNDDCLSTVSPKDFDLENDNCSSCSENEQCQTEAA